MMCFKLIVFQTILYDYNIVHLVSNIGLYTDLKWKYLMEESYEVD